MRVNYGRKALVVISSLPVGATFIAEKSDTKEPQLYMVVDKNSGVFSQCVHNYCMCVNLSTGQIRRFGSYITVSEVKAEATILE